MTRSHFPSEGVNTTYDPPFGCLATILIIRAISRAILGIKISLLDIYFTARFHFIIRVNK